jgi:hypothetical protein
MDTIRFTDLLRELAAAVSRRGLFRALGSGEFTAAIAGSVTDSAAKKNGKRKKQRRKKKKGGAAAPSPPPASPVTRIDATCSRGESPLPLDADDGGRLAQTFIPNSTGQLVRAELSIFKAVGTTGDYILHLAPVDAFGIPTNEILAVSSVTNASLPSSGVVTAAFAFANPALVVAGTQYAIVLSRQGPGLVWVARDGDSCGGQPFSSPDRTAPFVSTPFGSLLDCIFTTFVAS